MASPAEGNTPADGPLRDEADPADDGQHQHQHQHQHQQQASSKKRRSQANSRGVANLTPEQLARKRANDREAQRAIRERTKKQIDRLNERIRELESQQPYHDLQLVLREKEAVQAENADMKKRLESVMAIIQPMIAVRESSSSASSSSSTSLALSLSSSAAVAAAGGLNELAAAAVAVPHHHHHHQNQHQTQNQSQPPRGLPHAATAATTVDARHYHATLHDIAAASSTNGAHHAQCQSPSATDNGCPWLYPPADAPTAHPHPNSHLGRYSTDSPAAPYDHDRTPLMQPDMPFDERLGVEFLLDNGQRRAVDPNLPLPQQPPPPTSHGSSPQHAQYAPNMVAHLTLPRNLPATCPLEVILLEFLQDRQSRAAEGVPIKTLVGPHYPNFTSLVFPDRVVEAHPLSMLFTDILRTFPDICGIPEQVAIVFVMYLLMRWQIEPTQENYDRLPHWITPRPSQLFTTHPAWFDHLPWPRLRDKMIDQQPFVQFEHFFIPYTTTVSLNWPYEPRDCLLPASKINTHSLSTTSSSVPLAASPFSNHANAASPAAPGTPQTRAGTPGTNTIGPRLPEDDDSWLINPAFESHLRDLNNWTLGPSFKTMYPQFADCVKIKYGR
ncbi:hypothetical protein IAQ61_005604 [Plenodomus lingam]|uniref:uncharacterized protein n=1 Tax=Leptosphaeria maculans TaxID=5022 RepID=UPI0033339BE9|nr:hypothetical protein IAQ61_005604 [Plenodomus lingam]